MLRTTPKSMPDAEAALKHAIAVRFKPSLCPLKNGFVTEKKKKKQKREGGTKLT